MSEGLDGPVGLAATKEQGAGTRLAAALAVADVLGAGRALDAALAQRSVRLTDPRDRALAQEIAYGVLRFLPRLRGYADRLMAHGRSPRDLDLECLLLVGLYQLDALRVPAHAAVSQTVAAVRQLGKPWAGNFLNAVLRSFQRRGQGDSLQRELAAHHCFPDWLAERLRSVWPEDAERLMEESNRHPPMTLRVNLARLSRRAYAERLASAGLTARPLAEAPTALVLDRPVDVSALPGFAAGLISIQDGAAQLAAPLLEARPGDQVLDACAAPGGKTAHILESSPGVEVTAVDLDRGRLQSMREGLARLDLNPRMLAANLAADPSGAPLAAAPWADRLYDRMLVDAPCSATGVIRRHPDIKWLRRATDIAALAATQRRILDRVWPHLRTGGMLVYVTCSLLLEENHEQMLDFLRRTPDARELPLRVAWGRVCPVGRQLLTGEGGMDGFYFARLIRVGKAVPL